MNEFESREPKGPAKSRAAYDRDAALGRLSSTRRWVAGGAAALTAAFAALVSTITPGHTASASARSAPPASTGAGASGSASRTRTRVKMPPLAGASELGLQGPSSPPQSVPAQSAPVAAPSPSPSAAAASATVAPAPAPTGPAPAAVSGGS